MAMQVSITAKTDQGIGEGELEAALKEAIEDRLPNLQKVLLLPPDLTRLHSGAGRIAAFYYRLLKERCHVDIMPALGTHDAMTQEECARFFGGDVPYSAVIEHDWRHDVEKIGQVPASFVSQVSEGLIAEPIDVELNRRLLDGNYDLIISIGQVVPHEVAGMANYSKNLFVGCGGSSMIGSSHMLGAVYGLERIMGRDFSPVRKVFDYAESLIQNLPVLYVLTVAGQDGGKTVLHGLFIGRDRSLFEQAVKLSQQKNLTYVEKPLEKVVVYLDSNEFKSTWLGNKAIYRTRMAIADGGELIILAPGVRKFGEDSANDALIRKYGYIGRDRILELCRTKKDLQDNLSVAAHLIHGSPDGRFTVTYAADKLTRQEVEGVSFGYMPYAEAAEKYNPAVLRDGFNTVGGREMFYISNPALGLWAEKKRFKGRE